MATTRFEWAVDEFKRAATSLARETSDPYLEVGRMTELGLRLAAARRELFRLNREAANRDSRALTILMRHLNESLECPLCGVSDGEHEPDEPCGQAQAILGGDDHA